MAGHLLGIDIGGTKAVAVLARRGGEILEERRVEGWPLGEAARDVDVLIDHTRALLERGGLTPTDIGALGVCAPGPLDPLAGIVIGAPNLEGWDHFPLRERLEQALRIPVRIENDANAAALAEWRYGAGRGARNLLFLTMSTGVGGGLILDGRLYRGTHFQAGEVGHIPIVGDGRLCGCGMRGCLEAYTSGAAIARRVRDDIQGGQGTRILELAQGDPARINARHWTEAIRSGDGYALRLREEFLDHLAQGLAVLVMLLDPERIVLGTIVQQNPDLFLEGLRERTRARVWSVLRGVEISPGELGERLPAYAALSVAEGEAPGPSE